MLPRTKPEHREPFYADVEALISPGFLSHSVTIDRTPLCLRTLSPGDMFLLRARMNADHLSWKVHAVSASVWMANGINLLEHRGVESRVLEAIRNLPATALDILFSIVIGLFSRQDRACQAVESYCYEYSSRYHWRSLNGRSFAEHAGVPGVERLGSNNIQRMWTAFNVFEDRRELEDVQWEGFKLVASAMSPNGIKKLDSRDQQRRRQEAQRRQTVQDRFFFWSLKLLRSLSPQRKAQITFDPTFSKSTEDLEEEMRRWVSGEEDWHDKVVRQYKQQVIDRLEARQAEQARIRSAVQSEMALRGEDLGPSTALTGYTPDQLAGLLKDRQPGPATVRLVDEGSYQKEYVYDKYLKRAPDPGRLRADGDHVVVAGQPNLNETIAQRRVVLRGEQDDR